jgi:membrane protease YdiL (CAAX protease family)
MPIIRKVTGETRLVWRLILIILLYVAAAVLLRLIPISLYTAVLVKDGMAQGNALEKASSFILEDPAWNTAIGVLSGLIGFLIVWFLISVIEKSNFTWKTVGLDWKRNSLLVILLGAVLAFLLFIAYILTGNILGSTDFSRISPRMNGSAFVFFQKFVLYLAMGFGEEIVFRGYVQTRLVERYRAIWGILITAVVFVLLHQISYGLSPVIILSGVMLWTTVGVLYHLSKSLYLVVIYHGLMNTLMNTLDIEAGDIASMIVHALALSLVIVVALVRSKGSGIHPKPI